MSCWGYFISLGFIYPQQFNGNLKLMQYKSGCFIMPEVQMRSKLVPDGGLSIAFKLLFKPENFDLSCFLTKISL